MDPLGSRQRPFFGLKWRTLAAFSVVLVLVNAGLAHLVHKRSTRQFEAEQASRRLTQIRAFDAVLSKSFESMSTMAALLPRLGAPHDADGGGWQPRQILAALEAHGQMLGLEWGVEGVHYFEGSLRVTPTFSWPQGGRTPPLGRLMETAARDEAPQGRLVCRVNCIQLVVLPLLRQGVTGGFLVVERSIGDSLREFHLLSGAQVVLLHHPSGKDPPHRRVGGWEHDIALVTHADLVLPLIEAAAGRLTLEAIRDGPQRIRFAGDWYEIFALPAMPGGAATTVLLVNRVTGQVKAIEEATEDSVLLGLGGLLVSEMVLLMLLWGPMQRIQRVVQALPLLAGKQYALLRKDLSGIAGRGAIRNEIDVMVEVIAGVSAQIESLDGACSAAEWALQESEQGLQMAQSLARVAGWTGRPTDGSFEIGQGGQRISAVLAQVRRWSEFLALVHPDDRCAVLKAWRGGRPGGSLDIEFRLLIGDRVIDIHAMAEFEAIGRARVLSATGMMQDVSETRAVQRALEGHRDRLEQAVRQRTAELYAACNRAERLACDKGRFLANMSHEVRTPLNAVLGLCQLGLQQGPNPRVTATLEQILAAGGHLLDVVNDVLDAAKLEAGKLTIVPCAFDLRDSIRKCTDMLRPHAASKSLMITATIADDVPAALIGDGLRLRQILINLLGNAVKFTQHGAVSLGVERDGDSYCFRVRDTGVGISVAQIDHLFAPFHQGAHARDRGREGTGLGLSISRALAVEMGGDIHVHSEPGEGSEFVLRLPLQTSPAPCAPAGADHPLPSSGNRLAGIRVLVADDMAVSRKILVALLEAEGARVTAVNDGRCAVDAVLGGGGKGFDLVLMDVEMPGVDGRHAAREIRLAGVDVPIIGVTGHVSADERIASIAAGMDHQLVKPVMQPTLIRTVLDYRGRPPRCRASEDRVAVEHGAIDADPLHGRSRRGAELHHAARTAADCAGHELLQ